MVDLRVATAILTSILAAASLLVMISRRKRKQESYSDLSDKEEDGETTDTTLSSLDRMSAYGDIVIPVGVIRSVFGNKRGVPRQGLLAPSTRARIELSSAVMSGNSLAGLQEFSHVWIVVLCSRNANTTALQKWRSRERNLFPSKVRPPLLGGKRMGVFATRSPHRPNPIGLTLAKIDSVDVVRGHIIVDGVDFCDMTPVIDLKPFVPADRPVDEPSFPTWVTKGAEMCYEIQFSEDAEEALRNGLRGAEFYENAEDLRVGLIEVLRLDVRGINQGRGTVDPTREHKTTVDGVSATFTFIANQIVVVKELTLESY